MLPCTPHPPRFLCMGLALAATLLLGPKRLHGPRSWFTIIVHCFIYALHCYYFQRASRLGHKNIDRSAPINRYRPAKHCARIARNASSRYYVYFFAHRLHILPYTCLRNIRLAHSLLSLSTMLSTHLALSFSASPREPLALARSQPLSRSQSRSPAPSHTIGGLIMFLDPQMHMAGHALLMKNFGQLWRRWRHLATSHFEQPEQTWATAARPAAGSQEISTANTAQIVTTTNQTQQLIACDRQVKIMVEFTSAPVSLIWAQSTIWGQLGKTKAASTAVCPCSPKLSFDMRWPTRNSRARRYGYS